MGPFAAALMGLIVLSAPSTLPRFPAGFVQVRDADLVVQGIAFPPAIGGFARGGSRNFEPADSGLGSSVAYSMPGVTATIFVYDKRMADIPSGSGSAVVTAELVQALVDVDGLARQGAYRAWQLLERGEFQDPESALSYQYAALDLVRSDGERRHSYLFVTGHHGKFIKVRVTAVRRPESAEQAKVFVKELGKVLNR